MKTIVSTAFRESILLGILAGAGLISILLVGQLRYEEALSEAVREGALFPVICPAGQLMQHASVLVLASLMTIIVNRKDRWPKIMAMVVIVVAIGIGLAYVGINIIEKWNARF